MNTIPGMPCINHDQQTSKAFASNDSFYEATRWSLAVDATKLTAPILIVSGALDILTPPETGAALAALYGATYQLEPARGHNDKSPRPKSPISR